MASLDQLVTDTIYSNIDKAKPETPGFHFDQLKMYFKRPYQITENLIGFQPTVGNIIDFGEKEFFSVLNPFIAHTTQYKVILWEKGIDWNKISDFRLFSTLSTALPQDKTSLLFGDVDFTKFKTYEIPLTPEQEEFNAIPENKKNKFKPTLYMLNEEQNILIFEKEYLEMAEYFRTMFGIFPKVQKAKTKETKKDLIDIDKEDARKAQEDGSANTSFLLPKISACVNHPGFKYKTTELEEIGIFEFMDSVQRLQIYESTIALRHGMYSGFADLSGVDKELFDFMRPIKADTH